MSERHDQPEAFDPRRSGAVGEGDLMAYAEGELSPERTDQVRAWTSQRPRMHERLETIRREREILRSIEDEMAPAGLVESAIQIAEREALLGEEFFEALPAAPLPMRAQRPAGAPWRALAMAACVV